MKPLVAIHCLVYNHEPYLRDCFEGFVMQKTNFPFVAIVHDDASTDGSVAIIREYEEKYPHIFKPIYETENQWSKQDGTLTHIMYTSIDATGAKYVAMCEGDDYWVDSMKIQKQVDFLEKNKDYGFVGARCMIMNNDVLTKDNYPIHTVSAVNGIECYGDVFQMYAIYGPVTRTCSLLFRKALVADETMNFTGDYFLQAILAYKSKFARLSTCSCVYRIHSGGISNDYSDEGSLTYTKWYINQKRLLMQRFPNVCNYTEEELNDMLEYKKLQNAIQRFNYVDYSKIKSYIQTDVYKNRILYRKIYGRLSFFLVCCIYYIKRRIK